MDSFDNLSKQALAMTAAKLNDVFKKPDAYSVIDGDKTHLEVKGWKSIHHLKQFSVAKSKPLLDDLFYFRNTLNLPTALMMIAEEYNEVYPELKYLVPKLLDYMAIAALLTPAQLQQMIGKAESVTRQTLKRRRNVNVKVDLPTTGEWVDDHPFYHATRYAEFEKFLSFEKLFCDFVPDTFALDYIKAVNMETLSYFAKSQEKKSAIGWNVMFSKPIVMDFATQHAQGFTYSKSDSAAFVDTIKPYLGENVVVAGNFLTRGLLKTAKTVELSPSNTNQVTFYTIVNINLFAKVVNDKVMMQGKAFSVADLKFPQEYYKDPIDLSSIPDPEDEKLIEDFFAKVKSDADPEAKKIKVESDTA